jgi:hypothetical protein
MSSAQEDKIEKRKLLKKQNYHNTLIQVNFGFTER